MSNIFSDIVKQWSIVAVTPNNIAGATPTEQKRRIGVVISNEVSNTKTKQSTVALCTTNTKRNYLPNAMEFFCSSNQTWNLMMANQIATVHNTELEQLGEILSEQNILKAKEALAVQFSSKLTHKEYEPQIIIQQEIKEIEVIKEVAMTDIDIAYSEYLEAVEMEQLAKLETEKAYRKWEEALSQLQGKLNEHKSIIKDLNQQEKPETKQSPDKEEREKTRPRIKHQQGGQNKSWTKEELEKLAELHYYSTNLVEDRKKLALELGKSETAVRVKYSKLYGQRRD